ncbi:MAG: hypothetical protein JKY94_01965 [Rhodobacteraceae bacterium]|nr:hypothetical protein [Paracoccaceae bacterium]
MTGEICGFFGPKGSGKTNHALVGLKTHRRVILCGRNRQEAIERGARIVESPRALLECIKAAGSGAFRLAYRFGGLDTAAEFETVNRLAWAAEDVSLLWDEIDLFVPTAHLSGYGKLLVNEGRHRRVNIYFTSRRPMRVDRDLTANADRLCVFRTWEPRDIEYLTEFMGAAAKGARSLENFQYLDWRDGEEIVTSKKSWKY